MYAVSDNLVGKKNVVIPMKLEVNQKNYGWHPDQPVCVLKNKNADNARLVVGLKSNEIGTWKDNYICCGEVMEGYDKYLGTHAFAGQIIGCLMNGTANAGRVLEGFTAIPWPMMTDVVVDIATTASDTEEDSSKTLNGGVKFFYFGYRPYDETKGDKPEHIIGKAYAGKSAGSTTATIYVNTCL